MATLRANPGVVSVHGGWATLPNSPAAVEDGDVVAMTTGAATWSLLEPAEGTEVLVLMLVGVSGGTFSSVSINSDATRNALSFTDSVGGSECVALVYHLQEGDEFVAVRSQATSTRVLCWAVIDDSNLIPTDWELFSRTRTTGNTCRTGFWTASDTGIILGAAVVVDSASLDIGEPYDWTFIGETAAFGLSVNFAYGEVLAAGTTPPDAFTGTIPTGTSGEVYWFGVYDIGLRLRDAGSWSNGGGLLQQTPGPSEPPARRFPPPRALPNLPPEPTDIVVPNPPWIPPEGGGPYRPS